MSQHIACAFLLVVSMLATISLLSESAVAQRPSLWHRRDLQMTSFGTAVIAKQPGDLLFVTVTVQSDVENIDQRLLRKQNSSDSSGRAGYDVSGTSDTAGSIGFDHQTAANRQFDGNAQFRSERGFTDRFSVRVVDVMPNGNLVVAGSRDVGLEGDTRKLTLTGIVRKFDITSGNSVPSELVAAMTLKYESDPNGRGAERKFINQGWLGKKLNRLWPH
ncbi:MAG: flagellar basal body L-ring protein FlgH [Planctomycetota bacterium]